MDSEGDRPKKRKKNKKSALLDPEEVYGELVSQYNTSLATIQQGSYPPATPLKRKHVESSPGPDTESKRKVLFNLKLNKTQHFDQDDIVASTEIADFGPPKSVLKAPSPHKLHKKKRKTEESNQ